MITLSFCGKFLVETQNSLESNNQGLGKDYSRSSTDSKCIRKADGTPCRLPWSNDLRKVCKKKEIPKKECRKGKCRKGECARIPRYWFGK